MGKTNWRDVLDAATSRKWAYIGRSFIRKGKEILHESGAIMSPSEEYPVATSLRPEDAKAACLLMNAREELKALMDAHKAYWNAPLRDGPDTHSLLLDAYEALEAKLEVT